MGERGVEWASWQVISIMSQTRPLFISLRRHRSIRSHCRRQYSDVGWQRFYVGSQRRMITDDVPSWRRGRTGLYGPEMPFGAITHVSHCFTVNYKCLLDTVGTVKLVFREMIRRVRSMYSVISICTFLLQYAFFVVSATFVAIECSSVTEWPYFSW